VANRSDQDHYQHNPQVLQDQQHNQPQQQAHDNYQEVDYEYSYYYYLDEPEQAPPGYCDYYYSPESQYQNSNEACQPRYLHPQWVPQTQYEYPMPVQAHYTNYPLDLTVTSGSDLDLNPREVQNPNTAVNGYPYYAWDVASEDMHRSQYQANPTSSDNIVEPLNVIYHCNNSEEVTWEHEI
jgi:hypothetical protein